MSSQEIIIGDGLSDRDYIKNLIRYRELFYFFAWRDILVRYKQAVFGISWALIRPLLNMAVFTFLFGKVARFSSGDVNYPLFVLAAMLPWQLFASVAAETCNCLVVNAPLVSKVYFPRIAIPIAQIIANLLDFFITAALLLILAIITGNLNIWTFLTVPIFILQVSVLCAGIALWLSAVTVQYRDFRIVVPFAVQFGMFISPVGYGTFILPEEWQLLYCLNPMAGIIDGFRWAFFGITYPNLLLSIGTSMIISGFIFISGFKYFRNTEKTFADQI